MILISVLGHVEAQGKRGLPPLLGSLFTAPTGDELLHLHKPQNQTRLSFVSAGTHTGVLSLEVCWANDS